MDEKENVFMSPRRKSQMEHYKKTPDWKQRYKNRCKMRLQDNRTKLVDKFRGITLVQEVMKSEAADMGMTPEQLNELIEVDIKFFQEIEEELLQEQAALAMGEDEPIDDSVQGPPCPACKKNFADDGPVLCCSSCRLKVTVSTNPPMNLSEMYNSWFGKHAETCGWPADVFVIDNQILICCGGCNVKDFLPNVSVVSY